MTRLGTFDSIDATAAASDVRLQAAIAAHLACAAQIDGFDEVARVVACANDTGDELDSAVSHVNFWQLAAEQRVAVKDARMAMDAALRRFNQRSLRAGSIVLIEQQCAWSRAVLDRIPELANALIV